MLRAAPILAAVALLSLAAAAGASATHSMPRTGVQAFSLALDGRHLSLPGVHWHSGPVTITATSKRGEQEVTLMRFRPGYSYARFLADGRTVDSRAAGAASAYRRLMTRTEFVGGVDVFAGEPAAFTAAVRPGEYYLGQMNDRPLFRKIEVAGGPAAAMPVSRPTLEEHDGGFRVVHGPLPAHGTITIRNVGNLPHRLNLEPLKAGTTRAQVGAYLRRTGGGPYAPPPPFARRGPELGTSVLGPGRTMQFSYTVPAGTYAFISWQHDTPNGKSQALYGMYAVTTLR
jgi:hypothetical protein